jgi:hypothetical protein
VLDRARNCLTCTARSERVCAPPGTRTPNPLTSSPFWWSFVDSGHYLRVSRLRTRVICRRDGSYGAVFSDRKVSKRLSAKECGGSARGSRREGVGTGWQRSATGRATSYSAAVRAPQVASIVGLGLVQSSIALARMALMCSFVSANAKSMKLWQRLKGTPWLRQSAMPIICRPRATTVVFWSMTGMGIRWASSFAIVRSSACPPISPVSKLAIDPMSSCSFFLPFRSAFARSAMASQSACRRSPNRRFQVLGVRHSAARSETACCQPSVAVSTQNAAALSTRSCSRAVNVSGRTRRGGSERGLRGPCRTGILGCSLGPPRR